MKYRAGQNLVTQKNFFELFNGFSIRSNLEGLRLLVTSSASTVHRPLIPAANQRRTARRRDLL